MVNISCALIYATPDLLINQNITSNQVLISVLLILNAHSLGVCNAVFRNISECEEHMETHPSTCYMCDYKSEDPIELNNHELKQHLYQKCTPGSHEGKCEKICVDRKEHKCRVCKQTFVTVQELNSHIPTHSKAQPSNSISTPETNIQCDQCNFLAKDVTIFVNHILVAHNHSFVPCKYCSHEATSTDSLISHIIENHSDQELLNVISEQVSQVKF